MKTVITNNGQFNITEELYESIVSNNPELLMERDSLLLDPRGGYLQYDDNNDDNNDDIASNDNDEGVSHSKASDAKLASCTSAIEIIRKCPDIKQQEKIAKEWIQDNKEEDGTFCQDNKINNKIENMVNGVLNTIKQNRKQLIFNKNISDVDFNAMNDNLEKDGSMPSDDELKQILDNPRLAKLEERMIMNNRLILERCASKIQSTLGLLSSLPSFETKMSEMPVKYYNAGDEVYYILSDNNGTVVNSDGEKITNDNLIRNIKNNAKDILSKNEDNSEVLPNELNIQQQKKLANILRGKVSNNSPINTTINRKGEDTSGFMTSIQGGILIRNADNKDEAVKLYGQSVENSKNEVIRSLMKIRFGAEARSRSNIRRNNPESTHILDRVASNFDNLAATLTKQIIVTRENSFTSVVNTIRFDEFWQGKYTIENMSLPTQFDIKRQALKFTNKETGTVDALLIIKPFIGAGLKALKGINDVFDHKVKMSS